MRMPVVLRRWTWMLALGATHPVLGTTPEETTVDGIITDTEGHPLEGVAIEFRRTDPQTMLECSTDRHGSWKIQRIDPGEWSLSFQRSGYIGQTMVRTLYPRKKQNHIHLSLTKTPFDPGLAGIEISESKTSIVRSSLPESALRADAACAIEQGRWPEAVEDYTLLLQLHPEGLDLQETLAHLYMKMEDYEKAYEHYRLAYGDPPTTANALSNLAEVCLKKKDVRAAIGYLEKLLEIDPLQATAHFNLAELLLSADEPLEAIRHYEAAVTLRPDWAEVHLRLGYACLNLNLAEKARHAFERYLALAPNGADAAFVQNTIQLLK